MNPVLEQLRFMNKLVGFRKLRMMRKRHSLGLKYVRGYVTTQCMWNLMNVGLLDELLERGSVELEEFARVAPQGSDDHARASSFPFAHEPGDTSHRALDRGF